MHPDYLKAHELSGRVIGAAIEVHRGLGPGLLESVYERCFLHELELNRIQSASQIPVIINYIPMGLLLNFHEAVLKTGIHRLILPGSDTFGANSKSQPE